MTYTKELLRPIVWRNISMAGVLRDLGLRQSGGNHSYMKGVIKKLDLKTDHFRGKGSNFGDDHKGSRKKLWSEILVLRNSGEPRTKGNKLRRALVESGRPYKCADCGIDGEWNGKVLVLQPDHENGKGWDNRPENLNLRCPNCHSQTSNFAGRNRRVT